MAVNINERLVRLRQRRSGTDQLTRIDESFREALIAKASVEEGWQKRAVFKPNTQYAIGSMQAVDDDYTRISLETAQRVGSRLQKSLTRKGFNVDFQLQGSVPLDVHIRGVSDVDLLTLDQSFLIYASDGQRSRNGQYMPSKNTSLDVLWALRSDAEMTLVAAYPAANVDTSGAKAIKISGGSLARPVDVVPSHWYDTIDYQASGLEHDRGVYILDKKSVATFSNLPFLHIKRVSDRCTATGGSLRKAIRLCKNIKADAESDGKTIALSSFEIAALMFHANEHALLMGSVHELAILGETQRHLDFLYHNPAKATVLITPDGTRRILDTQAKVDALLTLSCEVDDLCRAVAREQSAVLALQKEPSLLESREALSSALVP